MVDTGKYSGIKIVMVNGTPMYEGYHISTGKVTRWPVSMGATTQVLNNQEARDLNALVAKQESSSSSSGGYRSYSSGGGGASGSMSRSEAFFDWMGFYPSSSLKSQMDNEGWTEDTIRRYAVKNGGNGTLMKKARATVQQLAAPFYDDHPSSVPSSLINTLISSGDWADEGYLVDTYFPQLKGGSATNPLASPFVDAWVDMTGRPLTYTATVKLSEIAKTYGFTETGLAAWSNWVKTTESAYTGNYGAEQRANITYAFNNILGRNPTANELTKGGGFWDLEGPALSEALMQSAEGRLLYADKPANESPADYISRLSGIDATLRWYYGDHVVQGDNGSLSIYTGAPDLAQQTTVNTGVVDIPSYTAPHSLQPEWKSLTNAQFASDLSAYGVSVYEGRYIKDGKELTTAELEALLPSDIYYHDAEGFHYVQTEGAINPNTGKPAAVTKPVQPTYGQSGTPGVDTATPQNPFANLGFKYLTPEFIAQLGPLTGDQLAQMFAWDEEADYMSGIYGDTMTEAFGGDGGINWYTVASGAKGSGAMRAKLVEAQNRVAYREAYRQVFGTDPGPSDYDRITNEFVSPSELIREHQAIESADEMYDEVNDLLQRVYGGGVSKDELKDMVLGRPNSGELKALINQATKLDQYTWMHKQYHGSDPTPADYAKYAGYTGPAELQWEIVTTEKIAEMKPEISEAWNKVYPDDPMLSDDELWTLYGEQQGYGDLRAKVKDVMKQASEKEQAEDWMYSGAEQAEQAYRISEQGGFRGNAPGLAEL